MKDKNIFYHIGKMLAGESYTICYQHKIPYPEGAECPACKREKDER